MLDALFDGIYEGTKESEKKTTKAEATKAEAPPTNNAKLPKNKAKVRLPPLKMPTAPPPKPTRSLPDVSPPATPPTKLQKTDVPVDPWPDAQPPMSPPVAECRGKQSKCCIANPSCRSSRAGDEANSHGAEEGRHVAQPALPRVGQRHQERIGDQARAEKMIFRSRFGNMKFTRYNHVVSRHSNATVDVCKFYNTRHIETHITTCLALGYIARRTANQIELRADLRYLVGGDLRNKSHKLSLWFFTRDLRISTIFPMSCRIRNCRVCRKLKS